MTARAVVLVSGGLDSATCLAIARSEGYECHALSLAYGQRHTAELDAAARVATALGAVEHRVMTVDLAAFGGSALTDPAIAVPESPGEGVPVTYVPARNTVFLSFALAWSEVLGAHDIFIGVNAVDYSGYPDCRPEYIAAFEQHGQPGDTRRNGGTTAALHPDAADPVEQGRHHPPGPDPGYRLFDHGVLLPGGRAGSGHAGAATRVACARQGSTQRGCRIRRATGDQDQSCERIGRMTFSTKRSFQGRRLHISSV